MEERNALVLSQKSEWITTLFAAFQDNENLYLVMEYVSGGSLRSLMNNRESIMEECEAKFYVAEMILALDALHGYNFIHRDVKPENYLIDAGGHIKLADFGSAIRVSETALISSHETVGTPDYISPEILRALEGNSNYGQTVDWWSLGVILFEMLYDEVPFYSESLIETYGKIMDHEKSFEFPQEPASVSDTCKNLISGLICSQENRLGRNGVKELKAHPWFSEINWNGIRKTQAPFVPQLSGPEDTRYFEDEENEFKKFNQKKMAKTTEFSGQNLPFVGYTYLKDATALISFSGKEGAQVFSENQSGSSQQIFECLKAANITLEKENNLLKSAIIDSKNELRCQTEALEKERYRLDNECSQLKLARENDAHEKQDLEQKLFNLKISIGNSSQNIIDTKELEEIRRMMENEIKQLTEELRNEKEQAMRMGHKFLESNKCVEELNEKIVNLNNLNKLSAQEKLNAISQAATLQKEVDKLADYNSSANQKISDLINSQTSLKNETDVTKISLKAKNEELEKLTQKINESEKSNAMLNVELTMLQKRIEELTNENLVNLAELQSSKEHIDQNEIFELHKKLLASENHAKKLSDKITDLNKKFLLSEIEFNSMVKSLEAEKESHLNVRNSFNELNRLLEKNQEEKISIIQEKKMMESQIFSLEAALLETNNNHIVKQNTIQKLEVRIQGYISQISSLTIELNETKVKYELEFQLNQSLKQKHNNIQEQYASELKNRISFEARSHQLEQSNWNLLQENERLNARISGLVKEREENAKSSHKYLAQLKAEETNAAHATTELERIKLDNALLMEEREEIRLLSLKAFEDYETIKNKHKSAEEKNSNLLKVLQQNKIKSDDLQTRLESVEQTNEVLKLKLEQLHLTQASNLDLLHDSGKSNLHTPIKKGWKSFFRKELSNELMQEEGHARNVSIDSSFSFRHVGSETAKSKMILEINYNLAEGMSGYLKIPKGGRVKKGWKTQFAIVKDFKLYILENESEAEAPHLMSPIAIDIRFGYKL